MDKWTLFRMFSSTHLRKKNNRPHEYNSPRVKRTPGAAFEHGRHDWFALRSTITNPRNFALPGGFWNRLLQETSQGYGRTKDWITRRLLYGPLRHRNSPTDEPIQNGRPIDPITSIVAQHCSVLVFPLQAFLCWKFRILILRNKVLVYLLTCGNVVMSCTPLTKAAKQVLAFWFAH